MKFKMMNTTRSIAQQIADWEKAHNTSVYVTLAKAGLWTVTAILILVVGAAARLGELGVIVQAAQVLAVVCITVLGYHGYAGGRVFHVLRHLGDQK